MQEDESGKGGDYCCGITEEALIALKPNHSLVFLDVLNDTSILRDLLAYLKAWIGSLPSSLKLFRHLEEDYILSTPDTTHRPQRDHIGGVIDGPILKES